MKNLTDMIIACGMAGLATAFSLEGCRNEEKKVDSNETVSINRVEEKNRKNGKREEVSDPNLDYGDMSNYMPDYDEIKDNLISYPSVEGDSIESMVEVNNDLEPLPEIDKITYGEFREAVGDRLNHLDGHLYVVATDLLRSFYNGVNSKQSGSLVGLSVALNPESYICIHESLREEYDRFDPEAFAKRSLWEPLRDEDGKISESDKWTYFIISQDEFLRDEFSDVSETYKKSEDMIEKELSEKVVGK